MDEITFFVVVDRESENTNLSSNGGDYTEGRTIAVKNGKPFAVRHWSSADFECCPHCGQYSDHDLPCQRSVMDLSGWESGERVDAMDAERFSSIMLRLENGLFAQ